MKYFDYVLEPHSSSILILSKAFRTDPFIQIEFSIWKLKKKMDYDNGMTKNCIEFAKSFLITALNVWKTAVDRSQARKKIWFWCRQYNVLSTHTNLS